MENNTLKQEQKMEEQTYSTLRRLLGDRSMITLTVNEFLTLIEGGVREAFESARELDSSRQARGWKAIADGLKVSTAKAKSLHQSGVISEAIIKDGGVVLCDIPKALKLYKEHTEQRSLVKLIPLRKTRHLEGQSKLLAVAKSLS